MRLLPILPFNIASTLVSLASCCSAARSLESQSSLTHWLVIENK